MDNLKELENSELISVYNLVLEHLEYLENEKSKMMEEEDERVVRK